MTPPPYDLLVVSDIHLTDGRNPVAGEEHLVPELSKMLAAHERHPKPGRHYRLVVNGDMFDFLHVRLNHQEDVPFALSPTERERGPGTSEEKSVWKLCRILDANGPFVKALASFLAAGNEAIILPGNHDLELYWPAVRAEIARAVKEAGDRTTFRPCKLVIRNHATCVESQEWHGSGHLASLVGIDGFFVQRPEQELSAGDAVTFYPL